MLPRPSLARATTFVKYQPWALPKVGRYRLIVLWLL